MNEAEVKKWLEQWKAAGPALEAFRAQELGELDEAKNAAIAMSFFVAKPDAQRPAPQTSGLVEQQAIFSKLRR